MTASARDPGSAAPVRAGVVGAGLMGRWHARELQRAGGALVGVADRDPRAAERLAPGTAVADLDALLALAPAVVHVCTPPASHAAIVERCLEAGAHVLCEKPLAPDAAATERLLQAAAANGLLLCPTHQYLFQPGVERVARALPALRPLLHADAVACSAGGEGRDPAELDGVVAEIVPHPLSVLERVLPGGVGELAWTVERPRRGELRAVARSGEASVGLLVSLGGRPTSNELRLIGTGATARLDFFHGYAVVEGGAVSRARKAAHPLALAGATAGTAAANLVRRTARSEPAYPGLRELIGRLYAAVSDGGPAPVGPEETIAVARATDALARGAA